MRACQSSKAEFASAPVEAVRGSYTDSLYLQTWLPDRPAPLPPLYLWMSQQGPTVKFRFLP